MWTNFVICSGSTQTGSHHLPQEEPLLTECPSDSLKLPRPHLLSQLKPQNAIYGTTSLCRINLSGNGIDVLQISFHIRPRLFIVISTPMTLQVGIVSVIAIHCSVIPVIMPPEMQNHVPLTPNWWMGLHFKEWQTLHRSCSTEFHTYFRSFKEIPNFMKR